MNDADDPAFTHTMMRGLVAATLGQVTVLSLMKGFGRTIWLPREAEEDKGAVAMSAAPESGRNPSSMKRRIVAETVNPTAAFGDEPLGYRGEGCRASPPLRRACCADPSRSL